MASHEPTTAPLSPRERDVITTIAARADDLLADLALHVALPTGNNNSPALDETRQRFMARLAAIGCTHTLVQGIERPTWLDGPTSMKKQVSLQAPPPTLISHSPTLDRPGLLILGHLDTVHDPASSFNKLTLRADGTATGPGCVDMKGGLVIAVAALEALADCGIEIPFGVLLNSDEETGSLHSAPAIAAEASSGRYRCGIALEPAHGPTGMPTSRGGSGTFMIETTGKAAHVGRDFAAGVSAVDALARAIVDTHQLSDARIGRCVNVSPLWCDQPTNQVADHAAAWGNTRFADASQQAWLDDAFNKLQREGVPGVRIRRAWQRPAKPETPAVRALAHTAQQVAAQLGQTITFTSTAGVCDGNNAQAAGLPTIDTLGVRGGGLHTPDEWIELASLVERCQLLAVLLIRLTIP